MNLHSVFRPLNPRGRHVPWVLSPPIQIHQNLKSLIKIMNFPSLFRRSQYILRTIKHIRSHCYVLLLLVHRHGPTIPEIFVVEEISHNITNGESLKRLLIFKLYNKYYLTFIFRFNSLPSWYMPSNCYSSIAITQELSSGGSVCMLLCSSSCSMSSINQLTRLERYHVKSNKSFHRVLILFLFIILKIIHYYMRILSSSLHLLSNNCIQA